MNENTRAAYRRIGEFLDGHNLEIYESLLAYGPQNCWEITVWTWLEADQVFRRMRDLERAGYVQRLDWVQDSPSGRACSVWWVR